MKLNGKQLNAVKSKTLQVKLGGEEVGLVLKAIPPGFTEKMKLLGVYTFPERPKRQKMIGAAIVKDRHGVPVEVDDKGTPAWEAYEKGVTVAVNRSMALTLAIGLRDSLLQFDAVAPTTDTTDEWCKYADALVSELNHPETGLTDAEQSYLIEQINQLDNRFDISKEAKSFLDQDA